MTPEILESSIVHLNPGRYVAWLMIGRTTRGQLLVVFSGDREGHVCPFSKTVMLRSDDQGHTWSAPELVNDTPLYDRDAGLCVCPDTTRMVSLAARN